MKENLLELLAAECNCFISSLPGIFGTERLLTALKNIQYADFPPEEWDYCLSYLSRQKVSLSGAADYEQFLRALENL